MDDKRKNEIREEAKRILEKFSKSLEKINVLKEKSNLKKENVGMREENSGSKCDNDFRSRLFQNAPSKNKDYIVTEKGKWVQ